MRWLKARWRAWKNRCRHANGVWHDEGSPYQTDWWWECPDCGQWDYCWEPSR